MFEEGEEMPNTMDICSFPTFSTHFSTSTPSPSSSSSSSLPLHNAEQGEVNKDRQIYQTSRTPYAGAGAWNSHHNGVIGVNV